MNQCEYCDEMFDDEPIADQVSTGCRLFCSIECWLNAIEEKRVNQLQDKREYEMYGDDLDSWYR